MAYAYKIMIHPTREEDLRSIFGVSDSVLTDSVINSLPNMPAAELKVIDAVPSYASITGNDQLKLQLAVLYYAAANCYQTVKLNVLQIETDNKTSGTRFSDLFKLKEQDLRDKAAAYLAEVTNSTMAEANQLSLFDAIKPSKDVVTGSPYAV